MTTNDPPIAMRLATRADALCLGVLATQVFLDTYAFAGITEAVAREVREAFSTESFCMLLAKKSTFITVAVPSAVQPRGSGGAARRCRCVAHALVR